jgi:S-DNA-T family DNA segregation ATPase FtsK/SpoIIIE
VNSLEAEFRGPASSTSPFTILVIDDGDELAEGDAAAGLESLARMSRDLRLRLLGAVESRAAHRAYGGWIPEVRKTRKGIILQPDHDVDGDLLGVRLPRRANGHFPPGRGFLVRRGLAELVQVAVSSAT